MLGLGMLGATGCYTVYQPLSGLQRPTAVDPQLPNFEALRMRVRCIPSEAMDEGDSEALCRRVRTLFANQGAEVDTQVPRRGGLSAGDEGEQKPELLMELSAREVASENSALLWILCFASATIIPGITDQTVALDVTLKDAQGFLLIQDRLHARFVRYFGIGTYAVNGLLDGLARKPEDRITTGRGAEDFSKDYYAQLSQLTFHARMRQRVQQNFEPVAPAKPQAGR